MVEKHSSAIRIILSRQFGGQKWCWIPTHFGRCRPPLGGVIEPLWHHRLPTVWERGLGANEADFSEQRGLLTTPGKRRCSRWRGGATETAKVVFLARIIYHTHQNSEIITVLGSRTRHAGTSSLCGELSLLLRYPPSGLTNVTIQVAPSPSDHPDILPTKERPLFLARLI